MEKLFQKVLEREKTILQIAFELQNQFSNIEDFDRYILEELKKRTKEGKK